MADGFAVAANEGIAFAALDAADGQLVLVAKLQAELMGKRFHRVRRAGDRRGRGIGGSGPGCLEILLIHHEFIRLDRAFIR